MCFFPFFAPSSAAERIAWLSASLPPEVKVISLGCAPMHAATVALAASKPSFASCPMVYRLDGFPKCSVIYGSIASSAVPLILVVAALSA